MHDYCHSVPSLKRSTAAVAVLFFVNGATFANWIPRLSEVRDRMGVSNSGLGGALLGGGLGGFLGSLLVARLVRASRTKTTVVGGSIAMAALLPLIAVVPNPALFLMILLALGFTDVQVDVGMNTQGVMVQTRTPRPIMQRLHGAWSLGMVTGGGIGWMLSASGVPLGAHLIGASVVMVVATVGASTGLLDEDDPAEPASSSNLDGNGGARGAVAGRLLSTTVLIGVLGFAVAVIESLPNEWSSVVMNDVFDAGQWKGAATSFFAAFMLIGRLGGDHAVVAFGRERVFSLGMGLCAGGAALLAVAPGTAVALAAYSMWGLGVSVLFPQLYELGARLPGITAAQGMGAMTLGQRLGFAFHAGSLGALADLTNFRVAIVLLIGFVISIIVGARRKL